MGGKPQRPALMSLLVLSLALVAWMLPFAVHPTSGAGEGFSFAAAGDLDWNTATTGPSLNKLAGAGGVNFFLALGDLGYTSDAPGWCRYFKGKFNDLEFITGNHDTTESGPGVLYGADGYIRNCPFTLGVPIIGEYGVEYYFDFPSANPLARVILVAPGIGGEVNYDYSPGTTHYNWVANAIDGARSGRIPWVIVGMHKPCLNTGMHGCAIPSSFEQMLLAKGVDLVLQGHDHNYQRTKQLVCEVMGSYNQSCIADAGPATFPKGNGTVKLITGTFGAPFYAIDKGDPNYPYFAEAQADSHGFVKYDVTPTKLSAVFVASTGSYTDSFSIKRPTPPPRVSIGSPRDGQAFPVAHINVSGNATDRGGSGLREVEVRINGGSWQVADGTSTWNISLELQTGANLIEARAWDNLGSISALSNVTATYSPPAPPPPPTPQAPAANIVASSVAGSIPFTATFAAEVRAGTPPYSFRWDFGDGTTSILERPTHTYERAGTYIVTLVVTDAAGLTASGTMEVAAHLDGTTTFRSPTPGAPWAPYAALVAGVAGGGSFLAFWLRRRRSRVLPGG